jgi:diadenylate cyclase
LNDYLVHFYRLFELRWGTVLAWLDILVVAVIIYRLFLLVRGPRAGRILTAVLMFVLLLIISQRLQFFELHWILDKAAFLAPVALVILFLPEVRQGLEGLGKLGFEPLQKLGRAESRSEFSRTEMRTIDEVVAAVTELAAGSVGALIVMERADKLDEIAANGVPLNADVRAPLLVSIFYEGNPLHDGAVIVRKEKILSAASRLPLSESSRLAQNVHMRHRAAVGVTEISDALAIIVSEERGTISYALEGNLRRLSSHMELRDVLNQEIRRDEVLRRRRSRELEREHKVVTP